MCVFFFRTRMGALFLLILMIQALLCIKFRSRLSGYFLQLSLSLKMSYSWEIAPLALRSRAGSAGFPGRCGCAESQRALEGRSTPSLLASGCILDEVSTNDASGLPSALFAKCTHIALGWRTSVVHGLASPGGDLEIAVMERYAYDPPGRMVARRRQEAA